MKHIRILLENGTKKRLTDILPSDKPIGIVLRSGYIVSLNLITPNHKIFFSGFNDIIAKAYYEKDFRGEENTRKLPLMINLGELEYIPALGELMEITTERNLIEYVRNYLHLSPLPPRSSWFWSSTKRDDNSMWVTNLQEGLIDWERWDYYFEDYYYILPFIKNENKVRK